MIELKDIKKSFGEIDALRGVTMHVEKHELLSVVGPSGCGKTTMLNIIAGLCSPDDGEVFINNVLVEGKIGRRRVHVKPSKRRIGYVFQNCALFPHMKVRDNVSYGLKAMHAPKREIAKRSSTILEFVGLQGRADSYPDELSGGEKQRVALARSLVMNPEVLLLDEPLMALDLKTRESLRSDFRKLLQVLKVTVVYVTHDLAEACALSDRIAVMGGGRLEQIGHCDGILEKPSSRFVAEFLGLNVYDGTFINEPSGQNKIRIGDVEIATPRLWSSGKRSVTVTLRPEDVILSSESEINNQKWRGCKCHSLEGTIVEIVKLKSNAKILVDAGFPIRSELTLSSLKDLDLDEGKKVYVHFKADSLNIC